MGLSYPHFVHLRSLATFFQGTHLKKIQFRPPTSWLGYFSFLGMSLLKKAVTTEKRGTTHNRRQVFVLSEDDQGLVDSLAELGGAQEEFIADLYHVWTYPNWKLSSRYLCAHSTCISKKNEILLQWLKLN